MSERVETERLVGERVCSEHYEALCALLCDPRVGATLGGTLTRDGVSASLADKVAHWQRYGFGYWMWRERSSGAPVARGGLQHTRVDGHDEVEVGWAVMADRWGEGFATELGAASVRFGFEELDLDDVVAYTLPTNRASSRVMEKLGFDYEKDVVHADLPHVLYRIAAPR